MWCSFYLFPIGNGYNHNLFIFFENLRCSVGNPYKIGYSSCFWTKYFARILANIAGLNFSLKKNLQSEMCSASENFNQFISYHLLRTFALFLYFRHSHTEMLRFVKDSVVTFFLHMSY